MKGSHPSRGSGLRLGQSSFVEGSGSCLGPALCTHCLLLEHARPPFPLRRHRGVMRRLAGGRLRHSGSPVHLDRLSPRRRASRLCSHPTPRSRRQRPNLAPAPHPQSRSGSRGGKTCVIRERHVQAGSDGGRVTAAYRGFPRGPVQTQSLSWDPCGVGSDIASRCRPSGRPEAG